MSNIILVTLKTDGGPGSATLACAELKPDPLFPEKIVLVGIQAFSWPFNGKYLYVEQWSVNREAVLHWMVGPLRNQFALNPDMLRGKAQDVIHPPGGAPNQALVNHPEKVEGLVSPDASPAAPPAPKPEPKAASKPEPKHEQVAPKPVQKAQAPTKAAPKPDPSPPPQEELSYVPGGWVVQSGW